MSRWLKRSALAAIRSAFSPTSTTRRSSADTRSSSPTIGHPLPTPFNEPMFAPGYDSYINVIYARSPVDRRRDARGFFGDLLGSAVPRVAIGAVVLLLVGCSNGGSGNTKQATSSTTSTSAAAKSVAARPIGTKQVTAGGNEITVYSVQSPARGTSPTRQAADPGLQYAVADVEICVRQPSGADREWAETMFALQTADNRRWGPQAKAETPVPPEFGYPRIAVGQCVRGWITFQAPIGQPITRVVWTDQGGSTSPPLIWAV